MSITYMQCSVRYKSLQICGIDPVCANNHVVLLGGIPGVVF